MSERSKFILGKHIFIKVVSLDYVQGSSTFDSLTNGKILPFESNEFLMSHLISKGGPILNNIPENNSLITPETEVLVSGRFYELDYFNKYSNTTYQDSVNDLLKEFILMDNYSKGIIKTALIVSRTVTGNYSDFFDKYSKRDNYNELVLDSLIHIAYLYHVLQNRYQTVHGDPKIQNYTWLELENPIDIEYDFRDEYSSDNNRIIKRKNVKHLFYLTDLEFVWSPVIKRDNKFYYNFNHNYYWYNSNREMIYIPKISNQEYYQLNFNLYGGYDLIPKQSRGNIYELYNPIFPRMFTVDILTLVKMLLTYWYAGSFDGNVLSKLNIYFSRFTSLSAMEENPHRRNTGNYLMISPGSFAVLLNS